ncbi:ribonuclease H-like domain-containing protein [Obelidium mucronatum]|nr:ribonuclease H-like domain-containing protein [Obelidium mucronatum]
MSELEQPPPEPSSEARVLALVAGLPECPLRLSASDEATIGPSERRVAVDAGASWTHHSLDAGMPRADELAAAAPFVLGVDEAGRGPVLGPMVYACAFAPLVKKALVKGIGVDDSKKLTEQDREALFVKMMTTEYKDWIGFAVTAISPRDISEGMLRRTKYNLNQQAYDTTIALIRDTLKKGVNVTEIYVDTVGKEKPYQEVLERHFPGISITVTTKADSKFPIVSAASIFAKVIRDCVMKNWIFSEAGVSDKPFTRVFGSGYPGDPNTKKWLKQNIDPIFGFPDMIRFSWSTCAKMLERSCAQVTWPDDDPAEKMRNGNIATYFQKSEASIKKAAVVSKTAESDSDDDDEDEDDGGDDDENGDEDNKADESIDEEELPAAKRTRSNTGKTSKSGAKASTKTRVEKKSAGSLGKRKRGTGTPAQGTDSDAELEDQPFVFDKVELARKEKALMVDTQRDALLFRGLSFRHVSVL